MFLLSRKADVEVDSEPVQAFCTNLLAHTREALSDPTLRDLLAMVQCNNMAERTQYAIRRCV